MVLVIEYLPENEKEIISVLDNYSVPHQIIGSTLSEKRITIKLLTSHFSLLTLLDEDMLVLRGIWEETSYQLERLQANPESALKRRRRISMTEKDPITF